MILSEMSHRWFNGLQVLDASISLGIRQSRTHAELTDHLASLRTRIVAMAALHRQLYDFADCDSASMQAGLMDLCTEVIRCFGRTDIVPKVKMSAIDLPRQRKICLAALAIELMTNALKHGQGPHLSGVISLTIVPTGRNRFQLLFVDNFSPPDSRILPRPKLVENLVDVLEGEIRIFVQPSYTTMVRFHGG